MSRVLEDMDKEKIRPIYSEFQGYLAQAPSDEKIPYIYEGNFWEQHNITIDELNSLTDKNYDKYKLTPIMLNSKRLVITRNMYRQKLGGLIARLHGEYFKDEPVPFAEMPSTIITQSQNQSQSVHIQLLLEVNDLINEKLNKVEEGSKEKGFLERIKDSLSSVKNISQLVTLLLTTAHQFGISIEQLKDLFN